MPYQPTTNFIDSTGVDLGRKFVTKAYLLEVYGRIVELLVPGITPTPALWVWGYNPFGQLALNDTTPNRLTPVTTLIGGNDWKSISLGKDYAVALKTNGTLWTWGVNTFGQLGINSTVSKSTPVTTILGGTNWASVAAGTTHTLAIKTDGTLWLWGENANGQIGVNDTTPNRLTPVTTLLGGTNWRFVAGGGYYTAAIKTDGTLWTWGNNTNGKLAINDLSSGAAKNTPVTTILGGTNWKSVACGLSHGSAIKTDGTLGFCKNCLILNKELLTRENSA
jgi:alpha-tubulin suppressor-like RCC1 family protein